MGILFYVYRCSSCLRPIFRLSSCLVNGDSAIVCSQVAWHSHVRGGAQLRALVALHRCAQAWRHLVVSVPFSATISRGVRNKSTVFCHVYVRSGAAAPPPPGDAPYGSAAAMWKRKHGRIPRGWSLDQGRRHGASCPACLLAHPFKPR